MSFSLPLNLFHSLWISFTPSESLSMQQQPLWRWKFAENGNRKEVTSTTDLARLRFNRNHLVSSSWLYRCTFNWVVFFATRWLSSFLCVASWKKMHALPWQRLETSKCRGGPQFATLQVWTNANIPEQKIRHFPP